LNCHLWAVIINEGKTFVPSMAITLVCWYRVSSNTMPLQTPISYTNCTSTNKSQLLES